MNFYLTTFSIRNQNNNFYRYNTSWFHRWASWRRLRFKVIREVQE